MKSLDKQAFAKLILDIYANYLRNYKYDAFYDILRLREVEINSNLVKFHIYFRRSGSDLYLDNETDNLHKAYMERNNLVLYVSYIPSIDKNSDIYDIQIIKDDFDYLQHNEILL